MASLQPYVSNIPLQVSKNLRFVDANSIPVTQMLPIGMNGTIPNDSPTTGYISRIGAVLSEQIDLYNQVTLTLQTYNQDISDLQSAVAALEISGTTIPIVNGQCFTGNSNSPITTVVEEIATSACSYNTVLGTPSELTQGIIAEGASALNILSAFSQASSMAGLSGWISVPSTIASSIKNLWLSYLDSRAGITKALAAITSTCSQVIIDFNAIYKSASGNASGFFIYFSGYSFIPSGYIDNGSTVTITDSHGGTYTSGLNIVNWSNAGTDALFVGISGTALSTSVSSYSVRVNSVIKSDANTCSKVVIHDTIASSISGTTSTSSCPDIGNYTHDVSSGTTAVSIVTGLTYTPRFMVPLPKNAYTATLLTGSNNNQVYYAYSLGGVTMYIPFGVTTGGTINLDWAVYK